MALVYALPQPVFIDGLDTSGAGRLQARSELAGNAAGSFSPRFEDEADFRLVARDL